MKKLLSQYPVPGVQCCISSFLLSYIYFEGGPFKINNHDETTKYLKQMRQSSYIFVLYKTQFIILTGLSHRSDLKKIFLPIGAWKHFLQGKISQTNYVISQGVGGCRQGYQVPQPVGQLPGNTAYSSGSASANRPAAPACQNKARISLGLSFCLPQSASAVAILVLLWKLLLCYQSMTVNVYIESCVVELKYMKMYISRINNDCKAQSPTDMCDKIRVSVKK